MFVETHYNKALILYTWINIPMQKRKRRTRAVLQLMVPHYLICLKYTKMLCNSDAALSGIFFFFFFFISMTGFHKTLIFSWVWQLFLIFKTILWQNNPLTLPECMTCLADSPHSGFHSIHLLRSGWCRALGSTPAMSVWTGRELNGASV